ncbi:MAG: sugar transferase [Chloroflexota bacterium]
MTPEKQGKSLACSLHPPLPTLRLTRFVLHYPSRAALRRIAKRIFDLVAAGLGTLCLAMALPFIALAIYLDSPGPIFYTQERVGQGGKPFRIHKFRSMVVDAEPDGRPRWTAEHDPRITRVGRILRSTHVDEFPQFLNILKGEMSVVGPRPERPEFVRLLARELPHYHLRHTVKPGMAGWGFVNQGYAASREDARLKLHYDLTYVHHQSLCLDVLILLRTLRRTLTFRGR